MGLPIDFEEKVKQPPAVGGVGGYPYSISAKHLMQNFAYASPVIPADDNGITETFKPGPGGHQTRELTTTPLDPGTSVGQIAVWDGSKWTPIPNPPAGSIPFFDGATIAWLEPPSGGEGISGLTHDGITPSYTATEACS